MKYKSGDSSKGTSLALPLRCIRATEYLGVLRVWTGATMIDGHGTLRVL